MAGIAGRTAAQVGGVGNTSLVATFLPTYWDSVLGENLYPNLTLYAFGTKRQIPRNFGFAIKIPRFKKRSGVVGLFTGTPSTSGSEGNAIIGTVGTCAAQSEFVSGTLKQFVGVYRHSDIVIMTAMSDIIDLSLKDIARDLALQMDTHIRSQISGTGRVIFSGGTSQATCGMTNYNYIRSVNLLKASATLDSNNNPRPAGGHYPAVIHPAQQYDLQSQLTGNSWLEVNKYKGNEEPENLYRAELGRIFGTVLTTSTNTKQFVGNAPDGVKFGPLCATHASGWMATVFAPEAYYVTEISDMTAKTFVKQLGSGGAWDPVNTVATVGAKVFFTAIPATYSSTEIRMCRIVAGGRSL